ncbi:MAG: hypothetical protein ABID54_09465 [Pseudomonadota bacterium]
MTEWKAVYRNKKRRPQDEKFACTSCGAVWDGSHSEGPPNGICTCGKDHSKTVSNEFKAGFDLIDWSTWQSRGHWEDLGKGKKRFIVGE